MTKYQNNTMQYKAKFVITYRIDRARSSRPTNAL